MRPPSFKKDGWAFIIPVLLIVSGLTRDPVHTVALVGALAACLLVAVLVVVEFVRWARTRRVATTPRPERVQT